MSFITTWRTISWRVVQDGSSFFRGNDTDHGVGFSLLFIATTFVATALVPTILYALLNVGEPRQVAAMFGVFMLFGVLVLLFLCLEMAICHAVLSVLGGQGVSKTLSSYAYPSLVRYGLWWVPVVNAGLGIYALYLTVIGLSEYHDIAARKAAVAVIVGLILSSPILLVGGAVIVAFVMDMGTQVSQPKP